jgi:uncharacterized membrane protein YsdA (DUF1294 family)
MATTILFYLLLTLNVATFFIYGLDKWKAIKGRWRIPEATLLWLAAAGGSIGAWCGIYVWHHKTTRKKFIYGVPAIFFAQCAAVVSAVMLWS